MSAMAAHVRRRHQHRPTGAPCQVGRRQDRWSRPWAWMSVVTVSASTQVRSDGPDEHGARLRHGIGGDPHATCHLDGRAGGFRGRFGKDGGRAAQRLADLPVGIGADDHDGHRAPGPGCLGDAACGGTTGSVGQRALGVASRMTAATVMVAGGAADAATDACRAAG